MSPGVSVIIPTYNRACDLRRCLRSLEAQTYKNFEVLVCDDGSTDNTGNVIAEFGGRLRVIYAVATNFGGPARPRNQGLRLAKAPHVALLDSDDWWAPWKLELSLAALTPDVDLVYHPLYVVTKGAGFPSHRSTRIWQLRQPVFEDLLMNGNPICNSSVVMRKELLERIGGFSEERSLIAVEDYDAWLRAARVSDRFKCVKRPLGYYWAGGGNISGTRRTIETTQAIENRYANELAGRGRHALWMQYAKARALGQLGQSAAAIAVLRIPNAVGPFDIRIRAAALALILRFRLRFGRAGGANDKPA